ncbi:DnaJ-domain-containing protein [Westerdykella ornata]|uniref:DnaJ-domain-containing protein n=1 Tax=Westerdykella ornata TaxID=318751 RepID=A0A6A6J919_WESOR|nr:DnaJ-domain-containing protein [Westerdykella ornata]KAF2272694.1 DnaJ-domain-containing protein [Westerdykella ornata]
MSSPPPNRDLEETAKTAPEDFYALLGITSDSSDSEIKRAYRKTSILYHPDKNPDDATAADTFIRLGLARDILLDVRLKAIYDGARVKRREKALREEMLDARRRKMKEELERREREGAGAVAGAKRKRMEEMDEVERREAEIARLAEDGRRRRREAQERLQRERERERAEAGAAGAAAGAAAAEATQDSKDPGANAKPLQTDGIPEIDRTIKIRFLRSDTDETSTWDKPTLATLFSKYGPVESVIVGKDKKMRLPGEKHRKVVAMVFIVYTRLHHAHAAVLDAKADFPLLESVGWAGKEPEIVSPAVGGNTVDNNGNGFNANGHTPSAPSTPQKPSFRSSFSASIGSRGIGGGAASVPGTPSFSFSFSPKTPNLEDITMMRLKQAEKRRLEEQIRRQEAAEEGEI